MEKTEASASPWYVDWQEPEHSFVFDGRHTLSDWELIRNYESFNDVRLLRERIGRWEEADLLEVGCATGEFYRYLQLKFPKIRYYGVDISQPAVQRAKEKYPEANFSTIHPEIPLRGLLPAIGLREKPALVYSKDVVHHQVRPFEFLSQLLELPSTALIFRTRTRDRGATVTDPELSCQFHYKGWMPYIILNLQELIDQLRDQAPQAEIVAYRNYLILGGKENRFLPKDCYLPETGTAETAVGVFWRTEHPGRVRTENRKDMNLAYPLGYRLRRYGHSTLFKFIGR